MFKRWVPISIVAVVVALALAGGAVLAAGGGNDDRRSDIFERAAETLGIGASQLEDAHSQATREINDEKLASIIEKMVADGALSQSEADSLTAWMAARPDFADEALFASLTSSAFSLRSLALAKLDLQRSGLHLGDDVTGRMAEILGLDQQELADALEGGVTGSTADARLAAMQTAIDDLLAADSITADEAVELRGWVAEIPQWLLEIDLSSRILPALGLAPGQYRLPEALRGLGFGSPFGPGHGGSGTPGFSFGDGGDGSGKFNFEFTKPEGTFRFGPGGPLQEHGATPSSPGEQVLPSGKDLFSDGRLQEFLDGFDFEKFLGPGGPGQRGNLDDLLERLRGHGPTDPPSAGPDGPAESPETPDTSA